MPGCLNKALTVGWLETFMPPPSVTWSTARPCPILRYTVFDFLSRDFAWSDRRLLCSPGSRKFPTIVFDSSAFYMWDSAVEPVPVFFRCSRNTEIYWNGLLVSLYPKRVNKNFQFKDLCLGLLLSMTLGVFKKKHKTKILRTCDKPYIFSYKIT